MTFLTLLPVQADKTLIRYVICIRWRISLSTREWLLHTDSCLSCRQAQFPEREARLDLGHPVNTKWRVALSTQSQKQCKIVPAAKDVNTLGNRQCWTPLSTQDIEGYPSVRVNVGMIDSSGEVNAWSNAWVINGEVYRQEEHAAYV